MNDNLEHLETIRENAEHAGDLYKVEWLQRFVTRFSERMTANGYEGPDLPEVAQQHAEASWGVRDQMMTSTEPEEAADGEYDALAESV